MKTINFPINLPGLHSVWLSVGYSEDGLHRADYLVSQTPPESAPTTSKEKTLIAQLRDELAQYWHNPSMHFAVPLFPHGTDYQQRVWALMQKIPVGQTRSYSEAATTLKSSPRAVGGACGANPLPLFIPCHRIVGKKALGGFAHQRGGVLLDLKKALLIHEGAPIA